MLLLLVMVVRLVWCLQISFLSSEPEVRWPEFTILAWVYLLVVHRLGTEAWVPRLA